MDKAVNILAIDRLRMGMDGEGVTTLVALYGCPLKCKYCINNECHTIPANAFSATARKVVEHCMIDNLYFLYTNGGITIGGGEPLMHPDFIHHLRKSMPSEWSLNIETSLNVPQKNVKKILNDISAWIIDIKDMNPEIYLRYTERPNDDVYNNLSLLSQQGLQGRCKIRIPLIPDYNTPDNQAESVRKLKEFGFTDFDLFEYKTKQESL